MRQALAVGVLALLLSGSFATAQASETSSTALASTQTGVMEASTTQQPDVEEWTSRLILTDHPKHKRAEIGKFAGGVLARTSKIAQELTRSALRFLGTPYVFGGTTTAGFDCSGYVQHVFAMLGMHLPRTADAQYDAGRRAIGGPKAGDLVFFQTYAPGVSHVGIYLGNGKFVHASSHGVMVSHLSDSYWASRYLGAKRLIATR